MSEDMMSVGQVIDSLFSRIARLEGRVKALEVADRDTREAFEDIWGSIHMLEKCVEDEPISQSTEEFVRVDRIIEEFADYQIEWLTSHKDIEFCKEEEDLIVQFLKDTAHCFICERGEKR